MYQKIFILFTIILHGCVHQELSSRDPNSSLLDKKVLSENIENQVSQHEYFSAGGRTCTKIFYKDDSHKTFCEVAPMQLTLVNDL